MRTVRGSSTNKKKAKKYAKKAKKGAFSFFEVYGTLPCFDGPCSFL